MDDGVEVLQGELLVSSKQGDNTYTAESGQCMVEGADTTSGEYGVDDLRVQSVCR